MLSLFKKFILSKEGSIQNENDTTISFSYDKLNYIFIYDKNDDPYYYRLILPNVFDINNNKENILEIINKENTKFKVAKSIILNNTVWISVEQFVYSTENINDLFNRSIILLQAYIKDFRDNNNK